MEEEMVISYVDMHTAGEPVRIVTDGYPKLQGATLLEKRREAKTFHDHLRRSMNLEPRGHSGMYGVIIVEPSPYALASGAVLGVLFTHHEGYSTMCGHATIAIGRYICDEGIVKKTEPVTHFMIEAPCGLLQLTCEIDPESKHVTRVSFESVPAFVFARDLIVAVPGYGDVQTDISYGGAFYCILPSSRFGLDFFDTPVDTLVAAASNLTDVVRRTIALSHPDDSDLAFLYGTILTDDASTAEPSYNLCVFADKQIDRSPTGSGVTARMALDYAKGAIPADTDRIFYGITGQPFIGRVTAAIGSSGAIASAVKVKVSGQSYYAGKGTFVLEANDPLRFGFSLANRFAEVRKL